MRASFVQIKKLQKLKTLEALYNIVENTGLTLFFRCYRPSANRKDNGYRSNFYLDKNVQAVLCLFPQIKSHSWKRMAFLSDVENTGFEPVTSCLPGKRSSQLS